jgi:hypothetical protein
MEQLRAIPKANIIAGKRISCLRKSVRRNKTRRDWTLEADLHNVGLLEEAAPPPEHSADQQRDDLPEFVVQSSYASGVACQSSLGGLRRSSDRLSGVRFWCCPVRWRCSLKINGRNDLQLVCSSAASSGRWIKTKSAQMDSSSSSAS